MKLCGTRTQDMSNGSRTHSPAVRPFYKLGLACAVTIAALAGGCSAGTSTPESTRAFEREIVRQRQFYEPDFFLPKKTDTKYPVKYTDSKITEADINGLTAPVERLECPVSFFSRPNKTYGEFQISHDNTVDEAGHQIYTLRIVASVGVNKDSISSTNLYNGSTKLTRTIKYDIMPTIFGIVRSTSTDELAAVLKFEFPQDKDGTEKNPNPQSYDATAFIRYVEKESGRRITRMQVVPERYNGHGTEGVATEFYLVPMASEHEPAFRYDGGVLGVRIAITGNAMEIVSNMLSHARIRWKPGNGVAITPILLIEPTQYDCNRFFY